MAEFQSSHDFSNFASFVKNKARYILDDKTWHFIDVLLETGQRRKTPLPKGTRLWRAQLGHECGPGVIEGIEYERGTGIQGLMMPGPHRPLRMLPRFDRAIEGRINPKGIPCLYLSTDRDSAMTEVRPLIGSHVSVAQFVVLRDLTLVNCTNDTRPPKIHAINSEVMPDAGEREQDVWWHVNQAFSESVNRDDDVADYAPTQVLAEAFQKGGFDGIVYGSKAGVGKNIALFDLAAAELANCHLYRLDAVNPTFRKAGNSYRSDGYDFDVPNVPATL
jgi:hypothetical protein